MTSVSKEDRVGTIIEGLGGGAVLTGGLTLAAIKEGSKNDSWCLVIAGVSGLIFGVYMLVRELRRPDPEQFTQVQLKLHSETVETFHSDGTYDLCQRKFLGLFCADWFVSNDQKITSLFTLDIEIFKGWNQHLIIVLN